ncbi:unnamed protein product, partial (macronuclear) [Paramecium tetraurelia]
LQRVLFLINFKCLYQYSRRFLYLDAINGIFATYQSKEDYPLKPNKIMVIELINSVKLSNNLLFFKVILFLSKNQIFQQQSSIVWLSNQQYSIRLERLEYTRNIINILLINSHIIFRLRNGIRDKIAVYRNRRSQFDCVKFQQNSSNLLNSQQDHQEQLIQQSIKLRSLGYVYKGVLKYEVWALKQQDKQRLKQSNNLDYVLTEVKILRTINHRFIQNYLMCNKQFKTFFFNFSNNKNFLFNCQTDYQLDEQSLLLSICISTISYTGIQSQTKFKQMLQVMYNQQILSCVNLQLRMNQHIHYVDLQHTLHQKFSTIMECQCQQITTKQGYYYMQCLLDILHFIKERQMYQSIE